jgi:hypothetical protein
VFVVGVLLGLSYPVKKHLESRSKRECEAQSAGNVGYLSKVCNAAIVL